MECKNHKEKPSAFICTVCGEALCDECAIELDKTVYCAECLENLVKGKSGEKTYKRYWWLAASLNIVPGTGHMYLGLIRKGLSLMTMLLSLVFLTILFSESSGMYWLSGFLIPSFYFVFLSYSIFDCISLTERVNAGEDVKNEGIYELALLRDLISRRKGLFSMLLICAGGIGIINLFSKFFSELVKQLTGISFSLTALLFSVLLIFLGFYLLREGRR